MEDSKDVSTVDGVWLEGNFVYDLIVKLVHFFYFIFFLFIMSLFFCLFFFLFLRSELIENALYFSISLANVLVHPGVHNFSCRTKDGRISFHFFFFSPFLFFFIFFLLPPVF